MTASFSRPAACLHPARRQFRRGARRPSGRAMRRSCGAPLVRTTILPDDVAVVCNGAGGRRRRPVAGPELATARSTQRQASSKHGVARCSRFPAGRSTCFYKALHGDRDPEGLLRRTRFAGKARSVHPPTIHLRRDAPISVVIARPTTAWAEVREQFRSLGTSAKELVFSDSRQDAANQSLEIERLHLRDLRREILVSVARAALSEAEATVPDRRSAERDDPGDGEGPILAASPR